MTQPPESLSLFSSHDSRERMFPDSTRRVAREDCQKPTVTQLCSLINP